MKHAIGLGLLVSTMAMSSQAVVFTLDLRAADGSKAVTLNNGSAGQSVVLSLYAVIPNGNFTHTDDGVVTIAGGVMSTEAAQSSGGLLGNCLTSGVSFATGFQSQFGTTGESQNLDSNSDWEIGNLNLTNTTSHWAVISATNSPTATYGVGDGTDATELLLGTITWTSVDGNLPGSFTSVNWTLRGGTTQVYRYVSDGSATIKKAGSDIALGAPVVISYTAVPEPACLSLLALGAAGLLARRRK